MHKRALFMLVILLLSACNISTNGGPVSDPTAAPTSVAQQPTDVAPTDAPPTDAPTDAPTTDVQATAIPPGTVPPTAIPPTAIPPTATEVVPTATLVPPTPIPPTSIPPTQVPTNVVDPGSLPTHTPSVDEVDPVETEAPLTIPIPITSSDGCRAAPAASAAGVFSAQAERAEAIRSAPLLPGVEPRNVVVPDEGQPRQAVIQFVETSAPAERFQYVQDIGGTVLRELARANALIVRLPASVDANNLPPSPIVVGVEVEQVAGATQSSTSPNDPRFAEQWAMGVVGLPRGWDELPANPRSITVAVIDSGICSGHPDLAGRLVAGYDFVENDTNPQDAFGHGCGVAGVIAANANNALGIAGVAPNVRIMPLRVLDENGLGGYSIISEAIYYAVDNGADIINLSLAGPNPSFLLEDAVNYAVQQGVIVVAAAGNNGTQGAWYPAAYPTVIAVGAVDPTLAGSSFSNFGDDVDVLAPGRDILTTNNAGDFQLMTGTSFAAPIVSGITALALALDVPLNTENGIIFLYTPNTLPECTLR